MVCLVSYRIPGSRDWNRCEQATNATKRKLGEGASFESKVNVRVSETFVSKNIKQLYLLSIANCLFVATSWMSNVGTAWPPPSLDRMLAAVGARKVRLDALIVATELAYIIQGGAFYLC